MLPKDRDNRLYPFQSNQQSDVINNHVHFGSVAFVLSIQRNFPFIYKNKRVV